VNGTAALLAVVVPAVTAVVGLPLGRRSRVWGQEWAVAGAFLTMLVAFVEAYAVLTGHAKVSISLLGRVDTGGVFLNLDLRSDQLSGLVAVAVGVVAFCVQVYSTAYLHGNGTPDAPVRYPAYAATVSLFTAAMMLVVHADDVVLLLIGWEVMGISSYLLVGHHSERNSARTAAVKAFLVTRVGDLGMMVAVLVLITSAGTTSIHLLIERAHELPTATVTAAAILMLAGVAGKSAQFPLHTWLPDAMEGPTPVSALIHAATMVAAGVYLVARLLPVFLAADAALTVAAVMASITMLGAALVALVQEDLKRVLAWSTISQVAYMLAGVAVAETEEGAGPGVFHLLSHAGFKALLFLLAGCAIHLVNSNDMSRMGGLIRTHPALAGLFALGLAALAGIPPFSGFWSKEAVLTAAEHAAVTGGGWPAWTVLISGLITALVTGVYAGRAFSLVVLGDPPQGQEHHTLPRAMTSMLWILAVPTAFLGLILLRPPELLVDVHIGMLTAVLGTVLSGAGFGWAMWASRLGQVDPTAGIPAGLRSFLADAYRLDGLQDRLVVRPVRALARVVAGGDRDVVDAYVRGSAIGTGWLGIAVRRAQSGLATGYVTWLVAGALVVGLAGVVLS
jgi:NADH-quinone oxidoreductase subunit L